MTIRYLGPLLRRQHTLEVDKDFGKYPETQVLVLAAKDLLVPLDKASTLLLDLRFLWVEPEAAPPHPTPLEPISVGYTKSTGLEDK